uniref:Alpha 1,4-glycosyltransferase domain-containing protein n=1 Tax=Dendroctonus ponderosae TaxID=77166 RepID=J3JYR6_DENPD|nr:unknown [Dendroctonus ponderosae]
MKVTRRYLQVLLVSCLIISTVLLLRYKNVTLPAFEWSSADELFCHDISDQAALPDISQHPPNPNKRNIFFLETTCNSFRRGKLFIKARQACAVESAARLNPDMDVHLLFASPGILKDENTQSDRLLHSLTAYPNVKLLHFDLQQFIQDSPVEELWSSGRIKESRYPVAHVSDILRLLTLWKFGGIYLDLDVIVLKSLTTLPENFAGAQSVDLVANGVMGFSRTGKGHQYMQECLEDAALNFNGIIWGENGPILITRNIFKHCSKFSYPMLIRFGICDEFRIIPPSGFYLLPYQNWQLFFEEDLAGNIVSYAEANSYLVHVWNKLSLNWTILKRDLNVPYLQLASKYCPGVVRELDVEF